MALFSLTQVHEPKGTQQQYTDCSSVVHWTTPNDLY